MHKKEKSNKRDILITFSIILFLLALFMAIISTSKVTAKKEELLEYRENSYIDYEVKEDNNININFNYNFLTNKKISFDYDYDITASVIARNKETDKNMYYNQIILMPSKKIGEVDTATYNINESLNINYEEYNKIVKEKLNKQDLTKIDAYMEISLNTNTISNNFSEKMQVNSNTLVKIPLLKDNILITKNELKEKNYLIGVKDVLIKNKKLFAIAIIMASLSSIILIIAFITFLINPTTKNNYHKEYKKVIKLLKEYDELIEVIYEMPNFKNKKIIEVNDIDDFITLRDKYELAITLVSLENFLIFIMIDNNNIWKYAIEMKK